jgi:GNAT superfamily N-acetyltransferase
MTYPTQYECDVVLRDGSTIRLRPIRPEDTGERVAVYCREPQAPDLAEVALAIADALQGRGVGTRMLEVLAGIARDHRITTFDAYVLQDNRRMMQVFRDSGLETHCQLEGGVFHVVLACGCPP